MYEKALRIYTKYQMPLSAQKVKELMSRADARADKAEDAAEKMREYERQGRFKDAARMARLAGLKDKEELYKKLASAAKAPVKTPVPGKTPPPLPSSAARTATPPPLPSAAPSDSPLPPGTEIEEVTDEMIESEGEKSTKGKLPRYRRFRRRRW